jgi:phosphoglycerol transferase MdoB-like AlkP superfamily enzyme
MLVLTLGRLGLALRFHERITLEPRYPLVFALGLRIDLLVACYLVAPPLLALLFLPGGWVRRLRLPLALYFAGGLTLLAAMEAISPDFVAQYDVRPNRLFVEYFGHSREVLGTIWAEYGAHVLLVLALVAALFAGALWFGRRLAEGLPGWSGARRALFLAPCVPLLFLGMRGTLRHRPLNAAMVAFSGQNLVNQLALNSSYTAARAWYDVRNEGSPSALYGRMDEAEILRRVARYTDLPAEGATSAIPFLHTQAPERALERPRNLVIVLEESLGAEFVGCLGGLPLTPCFDALTREGLLFSQLYCTGTRTVRGIEAVVSGFLPTPGSSTVRLSKSQQDFFTIAELLKRRGYATDFVYGGEKHFDNMAAFFLANGFQRAFDESDYVNPVFHGTWGVSDEDLMQKADELFAAHGEQPFFALVLTTTNHSPYEFPDGRIALHDAEKATRNNTVKYADYAIGELFRRAKERPYYANTLWLVVADHDERTYGDDLLPVDKFHIPGLLIGPDVEPGVFARVASQIDLVPTALDKLGLALEHPMIGRDLFHLPADDPGRAILQFNDVHGLLVGERLAVHPGGATPRCFERQGGRFVPVGDDAELLRDGLAFALLPGLLYERQLYRLPPAGPRRTD